MEYRFVDKVNNSISNINYEVKEIDFNSKELDMFYNKLRAFCRVNFPSNNYKDILNSKKRYGMSSELITKTNFYFLGVEEINVTIPNYYILEDSNKIIALGNDSEFIFIYTVNEYLSQYYDKYEKRNHDDLIKEYKERFPELSYDTNVLKTEFIMSSWINYYKSIDHERGISYFYSLMSVTYSYRLMKTFGIDRKYISGDVKDPESYEYFLEDGYDEAVTYKFNYVNDHLVFEKVILRKDEILLRCECEYNRDHYIYYKLLKSAVDIEAYHYLSYDIPQESLNYYKNISNKNILAKRR